MTLDGLKIINARQVADGIWAAGQPTPEQLQQLDAAGVRTVVNLCPAGECGWDERAKAESLGLHYINIPVATPADLTREAARQLHDALASCDRPVLVHCGSSNRVGALFALKARFVDGHDPDIAIEQGRAAGLKGLEPAVRQILSSN